MKLKLWVTLAAILMVLFIIWPKPEMKQVPVVPEHETIPSAIAEGTTDGVKNFVRNDLWLLPEGQKGQR